MFVDDASSRRFERARERGRGLSHIVVDDRLKLRRAVQSQERGQLGEQLPLARAEVAHELHEQLDVALLLADRDRRWMFAGAREPGAVDRARKLDPSLGAAACRANLLADRRAPASGAPDAA